jgi:hypothetical protein
MAVNTPMASGSAIVPDAINTKAIIETDANLFDPTHIPTIYPRIQLLSRLLIEASNSVHSLSIQEEQSTSDQAKPPTMAAASSSNVISGPDLAMGAMDEDDVNDGFEAALSLSFGVDEGQQKIKRTELAQSIVRESRGLREAFDRAKVAINSIEGGEMDIEEQERLITLLRDYSAEQE